MSRDTQIRSADGHVVVHVAVPFVVNAAAGPELL